MRSQSVRAIALSAFALVGVLAVAWFLSEERSADDRPQESSNARQAGRAESRSESVPSAETERAPLDRRGPDADQASSGRTLPVSADPVRSLPPLLGDAAPRLRRAEEAFTNAAAKKRADMATWDAVSEDAFVQLARLEALATLARQQRLFYAGRQEDRPVAQNTDSRLYSSVVIDGELLMFEIQRSEFPQVFGERLPLRLRNNPRLEELRAGDDGQSDVPPIGHALRNGASDEGADDSGDGRK